MVAIEVYRTPRNIVVDGVVLICVAVSVREGVMRQELLALRESLVHLHFEGIVSTSRVVAIVIAQVEGNRREKRSTVVRRNGRTEAIEFVVAGLARIGHDCASPRSRGYRIDIIVGTISCKPVGTLATHIRCFH